MIVRYYIYVINTNLTKGATKLSMKVDLIRLQKPSCNITEAHPKQDVDWKMYVCTFEKIRMYVWKNETPNEIT